MTFIINAQNFQYSFLPAAEHLPRNNVGMMFRLGHNYLITFTHESFAERESDKID